MAAPEASPNSVIADLRTFCLSRLDPAAVTLLPPDILIPEVERLISTIATERRIQLNAREQLQLAEELVDDMLGLRPARAAAGRRCDQRYHGQRP